jgi:ubiquitin-conjugating enzyme E2 variant
MGGSREQRSKELERGYTPLQRWINYGGMALVAGLTIGVVRDVVALSQIGQVAYLGLIVVGALLAAVPVADFATGLVHWAADNWGSEDWPIVGGFVKPFRNHHDDPKAMVEHGFMEKHGDHSIAVLPCFWWASLVDGSPAWCIFWQTFWVAVTYWTLFTADIHAWAHSDHKPRLVRLLQRARLILPPDHHDVHHTPPHGDNYCITTGWMNAPLRWLRFFRALEWLMTAVTGELPLHRRREIDGARNAARAAFGTDP